MELLIMANDIFALSHNGLATRVVISIISSYGSIRPLGNAFPPTMIKFRGSGYKQ